MGSPRPGRVGSLPGDFLTQLSRLTDKEMMPNATPFQSTPPSSGTDVFEGTPYRAVTRLAAGGMGEVFLVTHAKVGRTMAAKVLHARLAGDPRLVERARIEAQSLARLRHVNIVAVSGFGYTKDNRPYIIMEYLRGRTLGEEVVAVGHVPVIDAVRFASQLLSALGAAHELGVVHRDIKPSNIFLCNEHEGERTLKVLDFGVVRVLPDASKQAPEPLAVPTESGVLMGTPRFLSPEGAMGQRVDARADLYAAALMLYYMLTGRGPFDEIARDTAVLAAHAYKNPPTPSLFASQAIRPELDAIILKALRKDPASRYQSALEFKLALDRLAAMLVCPPALQETTVLGDLSVSSVPTVTKNDSRKPQSAIVVRALALFVLFGLLMAAVIAWTERSP